MSGIQRQEIQPPGAWRRQTVIVQYIPGSIGLDGCDWWVMLDDGSVLRFETPAEVFAAVQREARCGNRGGIITVVEWRDVPTDFTLPKGR